MQDLSFLSNAHPSYIDQLYKDYLNNPDTVDPEWKRFFAGFDLGVKSESAVDIGDLEPHNPKEYKVVKLIYAYRNKGHLIADTNPIRKRKDRHANLELSEYDLGEEDMETEFYAGYELGMGKAKLKDILAKLKKLYTRTIGWEYNYIDNRQERTWLRDQIERGYIAYEHPFEKKKRILQKLNDSAIYEKFLGTKFIGQKRFSLEGGESTIPALDSMINVAANFGCKEVAIGMAHRGRLNVLVNIVGKTYDEVFEEFEGVAPDDLSAGLGTSDVKYHKGYSGMYTTMDDKQVYIDLLPNPSHLEAVDGVVQGFVRSKLDNEYHFDFSTIMPICIHGDAALAGQGVVYEVLQMSQLKGFKTGGTVHFVINNQIGFTTDFDDARSSYYCSSLATTLQCPVFHVNGDDVEAVTFVAELAVEYRQRFHKDVFVDMVCYRKWGHNEGDDPHYTQPQMYNIIKKHDTVRDIYSKKLEGWGIAGAEFAKNMEKEYWAKLQEQLDETKEHPKPYQPQMGDPIWRKMRKAVAEDFESSPETKVSKGDLVKVIKALVKVPEGFTPLRKVNKMLEARRDTMREKKSVDWAAGEMLAYGTILLEKKIVRMSGQDVKRGTFSHRHAMIYDENTGAEYNRLNFIEEGQGKFEIYNSQLSEYSVLAFEYGYSFERPTNLVLWEAQFGDFANGAQIVMDQFIACSETKWNKNSGMILLLPHGYEGAGPDHSSARLERFLQECSDLNMVVTNITTPANFFHAIRRQLVWPFRKPLINMSPKSLLRHPECSSDVSELFEGKFHEIIDDDSVIKASAVKRLIFCSGKIYYDLYDYKKANNRDDVAIVRIEQLYPLAKVQLNAILKKYNKAEIFWVQEEPENMGAWWYIQNTLKDVSWKHVSRPASDSTATGFAKVHKLEQEEVVENAFKK